MTISVLRTVKDYKKMIIKEQNYYKCHIKNLLDKIIGWNKRRKKIIVKIFYLFLSIKGKLNFLQFARFVNLASNNYVNNGTIAS